MIKRTIKYQTYTKIQKEAVLRFHLDEVDIIKLDSELPGGLKGYFEGLFDDVTVNESGDEYSIEDSAALKILTFLELLVAMSYGILSPDGESFTRGEDVFNEFKHTAVYSEFMKGLFKEPDEAIRFFRELLGLSETDFEEAQSKYTGKLDAGTLANLRNR